MTTTDPEWSVVTPREAGFAPDSDDRFEIARQAGVLPNLHGVVASEKEAARVPPLNMTY